MTSVAIVRGKQPSKMIKTALKLLGREQLITPEDKVLIKPNYVTARKPSTGITTDSRVIESLIEFSRNSGARDIVVGEGGAGNTSKAFDVVGIREIAIRHKVRLVDLNQDRKITVRLPQNSELKEVKIARTAFESTCIINVPTLKVHHLTFVTVCMKNLMGTIIPKNIMHNQIDEKIVDLAFFFKDKVRMNFVDGLVGAEVDEVNGNPVTMDIILAGQDMVAVDAVSTAAMGIDVKRVKYLRLAEERGLGVASLRKIRVIGQRIEEIQRKFKLPPRLMKLNCRSRPRSSFQR